MVKDSKQLGRNHQQIKERQAKGRCFWKGGAGVFGGVLMDKSDSGIQRNGCEMKSLQITWICSSYYLDVPGS